MVVNINASIVDQRLTGILEKHAAVIPKGLDATTRRSFAFVLLCVMTALDLPIDEAIELITEGGQDEGVDALHFSEPEDGEFVVTIFQAKYKHKNLDGNSNFPENGVEKALNTVSNLFNPSKKLTLNEKLAPKIEEIRSFIRDGAIPVVKVILCSNGLKWSQIAEDKIKNSGFPSNQVHWKHFNHNAIVEIAQSRKSVDDSIRTEGEAVIEEFNFRRVFIGKIAVSEIANLFNKHGDLLLERNIRRYLGISNSNVNLGIQETLQDPKKCTDFYFYNNGITMICRKFRHNALQGDSYQLKIENMQIINGGQTCKTIQNTLNQPTLFTDNLKNTYVLLRLYELEDSDRDFVLDITKATNSQNPVDLRDLKSNDEKQKQLDFGIKDLGYFYKRQRDVNDESSSTTNSITANTVAEATLAVWRKNPTQAKYSRKTHFDKLYNTIFDDLSPAQAIVSVLIFRMVENDRKHKFSEKSPIFIPYASHYICMLIGECLLRKMNIDLVDLNHKNFKLTHALLLENYLKFYDSSVKKIAVSLKKLYGKRTVDAISLQQLAATFRRGDLMEYLTT